MSGENEILEQPPVDPAIEAPPVAPTPEPPPPPKEDWRDRRIGQLTARNAEKERKIAELEAKLAEKGQGGGAPPTVPALDEAEFNRRVELAAQERVRTQSQIERYNAQCNKCVSDGREAYGEAEFNGAINSVLKHVDQNDAASMTQYSTMLNAAFATEKAPHIVKYLGDHPEEAARILDLEPVQMAVEVAKLTGKIKEAPATAAPRPIKPLQGKPSAHADVHPDDKDNADALDTAEWMRRRNAQVAQKGR